MCIHSDSMVFPAHIREDGEIQTVAAHCRETGEIASFALSCLGLGQAAWLAGLLHDMGKLRAAFETYIRAAAAGQPVRHGSVNHTFAGVKYLLDTFHGKGAPVTCPDIVSELLAYAVGAHHGLFDLVNKDGESGFGHRAAYNSGDYAEAAGHFFEQCAKRDEIKTRFEAAVHEIEACIGKISTLPVTADNNAANQEMTFYCGMLARLLLSAVMEGDRRSTAIFMGTRPAEALPNDRGEIWQAALKNLECQLDALPCDTPVNQARREISNACRAFADKPSGLYRLNVPTGGGKTLASLRYALAHAQKWGKKRVFYIAPLISILEQNVDVIRNAVGDPDLVLEHHSNVVRDAEDTDELHRLELLEECWDAPIIVTTLVQLLNSLFAGKTGCIRRFHALTDSVIIIDEVQTVPANMLSLFNLAMNFLSEIGASTVLLCSATQPRFEEVAHALRVNDETPVPYSPALWQAFRRTQIQFAGNMRLEEIPSQAERKLANVNTLLIVCNKKSQAEALCEQLRDDSWKCFHLSASMCMAHRRRTLGGLYQSIELSRRGGPKTVCVSTQVIEAGVDISFDAVIRLCAGMDSVVQAAGRCNRNGENPSVAPVLLVNCENEKLTGLKAIQRGKKATNALLYAFKQTPERFHNDLAAFESIDFYYRELYHGICSDDKTGMDYSVDSLKTTLLDLLSFNTKFMPEKDADCSRYFLRQAFKTAGHLFTVFDSNTVDVIVPWEYGRDIIGRLMELDARWQLKEIGALLAEARAYTVSLYTWQVKKLSEQGGLYALCDGKVLALADGFYSDTTGLMTDRLTNGFLEV